MFLATQNYRKWADDTMAQDKYERYTIGEHGCVITSICNIVNMHKDYKPDEKPLMPNELNKMLKERSGYTENGSVIWSVLEKIIGAKIDPFFYLIEERGMEDRYGYPNFRQNDVYYIARLNSDTGYHFLQIIGSVSGTYILFDTYDDRFVYRNNNEIKRIIEVRFD